jgi:hypothetical protein
LSAALDLDAGFREASELRAVALSLGGRCHAAIPSLVDAARRTAPAVRAWPVETGPGDLNAAGLMRRQRITPLPAELTPAVRLSACREAAAAPGFSGGRVAAMVRIPAAGVPLPAKTAARPLAR